MWTATIPNPRGSSGAWAPLRDWELSGLAAFRTGFPYSIYAGVGAAGIINRRGDLVNPDARVHRSAGTWRWRQTAVIAGRVRGPFHAAWQRWTKRQCRPGALKRRSLREPVPRGAQPERNRPHRIARRSVQCAEPRQPGESRFHHRLRIWRGQIWPQTSAVGLPRPDSTDRNAKADTSNGASEMVIPRNLVSSDSFETLRGGTMRTQDSRRQMRPCYTRGIGAQWMRAASSALGVFSLLVMAANASGQTSTQQVITTVAGTDSAQGS